MQEYLVEVGIDAHATHHHFPLNEKDYHHRPKKKKEKKDYCNRLQRYIIQARLLLLPTPTSFLITMFAN